MGEYKTGLVSISFRGNTCEEILAAMKKAGLTCVEWGSDVHAPKENTAALRQIANWQNAYGIRCCSYGTYFRIGVTPLEELEEYIRAAKVLGTDVLRLWCGNKNSEEYREEEKTELFAVCQKAAEIAKKHAVTLCMECHGGTYTNTEKSALELMREVNHPSFLMYWQPQQFMSVEDNISYAQAISPYVKHIHVFHWIKDDRFPLEAGAEVWKKYLNVFEKDKHLLLEFMPDNKIETLEHEAAALRAILEGL